ncbi:MAG: TetM/TetW/TetO/TetS family tetracycline resistance ribosomal protection protein [Eubacteriales bacterium]|nr:TetM/TetW/TetO/TetS family tetracycline resistance ribosomal protection protein [Eubacteriales bacterium]
MGEQETKKVKKHISAGLLAHVDAGKTTLSEGLLYQCGKIRKMGRVDHGDAFLDTFELERERGITIFSKQAVLDIGDMEVTLLDTPGHVDFSAEMERTLQVLDYAILVISGADGVQGHTLTLWRLLARYKIPVFLFVNKMDQEGTNREALLADLKKHLDENCLDFDAQQPEEELMEALAMCGGEELLENYLERGTLEDREIIDLIASRKVFPCYFGSALKNTGVEEFLKGVEKYTHPPVYPVDFGAKVYKIARDDQGNRLTYMKITGGTLKVKTLLTNQKNIGSTVPHPVHEDEIWEEKADQIRIYSGAKYELVKEAEAGTVCAVTGLTRTYPGQGLGIESESDMPVLEPVLNYQIQLPADCDVHQMLRKLRQLEEEEPELHIVWDEQLGEIHAQLMGEVQIEILKRLIWDRFRVAVEFGTGNIVYKETIAAPVEGVGHFEPLRHYAEVHLLLEPGEPGSGLQFFTACSEDVLDRNWQRLILTHLEEKEHRGVLTGSAITDMQITLLTGRAHQKHTEGGDFRQATYRAVRQGLKKARTILLEPYYEFRLEVPSEMIGRAMTDIQKMQGTINPPEIDGEMSVLTGTAPVSSMRDYQNQVISYTKGRGRMFCSLKGYAPCRNQDEVVETIGYDAERDLENPTGSVFCAHGAGFVVPWDQVEEYMHLEGGIDLEEVRESGTVWYEDLSENEESTEESSFACSYPSFPAGGHSGKRSGSSYGSSYEDEKELQAIFERTFGPVKRERNAFQKKVVHAATDYGKYTPKKKAQEEYLLVDGYNIIFAWEDLKELAEVNIHAAQDKLMDILSNYQGFKKCVLILVFDAYKVEGHREEVIRYHNIHVVYTKEAETADQYIEKTVHRIGRQYQVTVATSDRLEQIIILGQGAHRISAQGLKEEIEDTTREIRHDWQTRRQSSKTYLFDNASGEVADYVETLRLGKGELKE